MSLTKQERENLLKTIEIASGGEISTNEANQMTGRLVDVDQLIYIAEQCYKEGVRKGQLETPLQYKLIDVLKSNAEMLEGAEITSVRDIRVILSEMMSAITCNYDDGDPFNPRYDSYIRLLLTILVDIVEIPTIKAYEIIQSKWDDIFNKKEEVKPCVDINIILCTGYSRMMVVLSNDETTRSDTIREKDFSDIVDYLITIYKEFHNDIIITQLLDVSAEDMNWEDYKTCVKCIEGDKSPITRAYIEEIISELEKEHFVELASLNDKIEQLNYYIDAYYKTPLDGFDGDIQNMLHY